MYQHSGPFERKWNRQLTRPNFPPGTEKYSLGTRLTSTMTALYDVVEHNLYAQFIQPFSFLRKEVHESSLWDYIELLLMFISLASHTLCRGLVMLQPSSCRHDRNLMWPIRSVLFIAHICVMWYNYITMCLTDVSILLSDTCVWKLCSLVTTRWLQPSSLRRVWVTSQCS